MASVPHSAERTTMTPTPPIAAVPAQPDASASMLVVYPRGQLTEFDKARMEAHGILAIEADDPKMVIQMPVYSSVPVPQSLQGDVLLRAALHVMAERPPCTDAGSINGIGRAAHEFIKHLAASMAIPSGEQP